MNLRGGVGNNVTRVLRYELGTLPNHQGWLHVIAWFFDESCAKSKPVPVKHVQDLVAKVLV